MESITTTTSHDNQASPITPSENGGHSSNNGHADAAVIKNKLLESLSAEQQEAIQSIIEV